jgi:hypothetical protein
LPPALLVPPKAFTGLVPALPLTEPPLLACPPVVALVPAVPGSSTLLSPAALSPSGSRVFTSAAQPPFKLAVHAKTDKMATKWPYRKRAARFRPECM